MPTDRIPQELADLAMEILREARDKGYNITKIEAYKIIAKKFKK